MRFAPRTFPTEIEGTQRAAEKRRTRARATRRPALDSVFWVWSLRFQPKTQNPKRKTPSAHRGFTLAEVLAALLMMAIIIPVAMEGMSVASRIGILGQRKADAMRVAERVLSELIVEGQTQQSSASGTAVDGDTAYPWSMRAQTWSEDAMLELVVTVTFTVQGSEYDVSTSTLIAPGATIETVAGTP